MVDMLFVHTREDKQFFINVARALHARKLTVEIVTVDSLIDAKFSARHVQRTLHQYQPRAIAMWGDGKIEHHVVRLCADAERIPTYYMENGLLPATVQVGRDGVNVRNRALLNYRPYQHDRILSDDHMAVAVDALRERYQHGGSVVSSLVPYIFFPMQVLGDSQIVVNSPWYHTVPLALLAVCRAADEFGLQVRTKLHPREPEPERVIDALHAMESVRNLTVFDASANLATLIEQSSLVCTVNSTVGVEAMFFRKIVLAMGWAAYATPEGTGAVAYQAYSQATLSMWMRNIKAGIYRDPDTQERRRWLSFLRDEMVAETPEAIAARLAQYIREDDR